MNANVKIVNLKRSLNSGELLGSIVTCGSNLKEYYNFKRYSKIYR